MIESLEPIHTDLYLYQTKGVYEMLNKLRLEKIIKNMKSVGLSQIIVSDDNAIFYLLGRFFHAYERVGVLLVKDTGEVHAFVNRVLSVEPIEGVTMHYHMDAENPYRQIADTLEPGKIGFDRKWMTQHTLLVLSERGDLEPVVGSEPVDTAKAEKDEVERELLRKASLANDRAIAYAISQIKEGITEIELSTKIRAFFEKECGAQYAPPVIVSFGAHGADPHHMPDNTVIKSGDTVLMDIYAQIDGYWCDMTRTVFYDKASDEHRNVYEIVRKAQQAGCDFVRPGVKISDVDAVVRKVIVDAGYGDKFTTRTGHGIGMDMHEPPSVVGGSDEIARPGMVFSIEPGIYLEGEIGIRIEDLVVVTEDGCEILNKYTKERQIVG